MNERKTILAQKLEARERVAVDVDVDGFVVFGGKELGKVKVWVATLLELERAAEGARGYVRTKYKYGKDDVEDQEMFDNARLVFLLHAVIRDFYDP